MMDDAMRETFAQQGYIVVPNVLNQQQLDELNRVYDQHVLERKETLSSSGTDNQNRFFIGFGWQASKKIALELGYMNFYTDKATGPNQLDHIVQLWMHLR